MHSATDFPRRICRPLALQAGLVLWFLAASTPSWAAKPNRSVHVFVALCDNENQGIVPVPAAIGNGQDPASNLYWGARYGVKNHLRRKTAWKLQSCGVGPIPEILERCVFRHQDSGSYLVADAYDGAQIRKAIEDFLDAVAGGQPQGGTQSDDPVKKAGAADLLVYVGHDGLMDFRVDGVAARDDRKRDTVVLACASRPFFQAPLQKAGANLLLGTTGLMAPEAYVLEAILDGWLLAESGEAIRTRAATAYHRYQKCGMKAARNLFRSGWPE